MWRFIHPPPLPRVLAPFPHNSQRLFARDCSGLKLVFGRIEFDVATPLPGYRSPNEIAFKPHVLRFLTFCQDPKKKKEMNSSDRMRLVERNCWINCSLNWNNYICDWYKLILFWIFFFFFFLKIMVQLRSLTFFFFYLSKGLRSKRLSIWKFMFLATKSTSNLLHDITRQGIKIFFLPPLSRYSAIISYRASILR